MDKLRQQRIVEGLCSECGGILDIDDNGILAEGLEIGCPFEDIWNSTIKKSDRVKYGWEANPWVWVIGFERFEKPESERDRK